MALIRARRLFSLKNLEDSKAAAEWRMQQGELIKKMMKLQLK